MIAASFSSPNRVSCDLQPSFFDVINRRALADGSTVQFRTNRAKLDLQQSSIHSSQMMQFPYMTDYVNDLFKDERNRWDFYFVRPVIVVFYFFLRCTVFPLKFIIHRNPYGFEGYLIDRVLGFGMKYLARQDAVELMIRHVQIEPLVYRHLLRFCDSSDQYPAGDRLNGIDGDFNVETIQDLYRHNMTIGHDLLSYEIGDRFDRQAFLDHVDQLRNFLPLDHQTLSKRAVEENQKHSWQILGATNVALLIVVTITMFADLKTAVTALNSFFSDSIVLWCVRHLYVNDPDVLIDLDFFSQEGTNRGHYNTSAFFSDPSRYLYYHIIFDEVVYDMLRNRRPTLSPDSMPNTFPEIPSPS